MDINTRKKVALTLSLAIISIFPLFSTIAPGEWPLQPTIVVVDLAFLALVAMYVPVITGRSRSKLLVNLVTLISIVCVGAICWLILTLAALKIQW